MKWGMYVGGSFDTLDETEYIFIKKNFQVPPPRTTLSGDFISTYTISPSVFLPSSDNDIWCTEEPTELTLIMLSDENHRPVVMVRAKKGTLYIVIFI